MIRIGKILPGKKRGHSPRPGASSPSLFVWQRNMVLRKDFLGLHTTSSSADRFGPQKECEYSEWRSLEWG